MGFNSGFKGLSIVVTGQLKNVYISCVMSVCLRGHVEETRPPPDISVKLYIDYSY